MKIPNKRKKGASKMGLVREAIDSITWNMTHVVYGPSLTQPLVAKSIGEPDALTAVTTWVKKGGRLRAASISNRFLLPINEERAKSSTAKATADLDILKVFQYLKYCLGSDEQGNFIYDRFKDGKPASKEECRKRLFQAVTKSKREAKMAR